VRADTGRGAVPVVTVQHRNKISQRCWDDLSKLASHGWEPLPNRFQHVSRHLPAPVTKGKWRLPRHRRCTRTSGCTRACALDVVHGTRMGQVAGTVALAPAVTLLSASAVTLHAQYHVQQRPHSCHKRLPLPTLWATVTLATAVTGTLIICR